MFARTRSDFAFAPIVLGIGLVAACGPTGRGVPAHTRHVDRGAAKDALEATKLLTDPIVIDSSVLRGGSADYLTPSASFKGGPSEYTFAPSPSRNPSAETEREAEPSPDPFLVHAPKEPPEIGPAEDMLIAAQGGLVVSRDDAVRIKIPAHALPEDTLATIRAISRSRWPASLSKLPLFGPVYVANIGDTLLARPARVSYRLDQNTATAERLPVVYLGTIDTDGVVQLLEDLEITADSGRLVVSGQLTKSGTVFVFHADAMVEATCAVGDAVSESCSQGSTLDADLFVTHPTGAAELTSVRNRADGSRVIEHKALGKHKKLAAAQRTCARGATHAFGVSYDIQQSFAEQPWAPTLNVWSGSVTVRKQLGRATCMPMNP